MCILIVRTFLLFSLISDDVKRAVFATYLKCHTCYDIVPRSGKIVIFDTRLLVSVFEYIGKKSERHLKYSFLFDPEGQ